jgi:AcrR family transcriptional regulator
MNKRVSQKADKEAWTGDPLPRGRHKLPREAVRASQRERLLRAMAELVGERGFEATTVPQVISRARVSSNTFYSFFSDKIDCFIALCEQMGEELFEALEEPEESNVAGALEALDRGIRTYLTWMRDRPAYARAYFVELPAAGPRAMEERDRQYEWFRAIHRLIAERARQVYPAAPPVREIDVTASVILTTELVAKEVRDGRIDKLLGLEDELRYLILKLLVGAEAAEYAGAAGL